jgi:two-component system, chemotaxis family, chemotaxis protein CheY
VGSESISVLIVDDSAAIRSVLRAILNSAGYPVIGEAGSGNSAIAMAARLKPKVITLNLVMPDVSGLDALPEIRRASPDSLVLVVSSDDDPATARKAFDLGAVGFVTKPFNQDRVLRLFDQLARVAAKPKPGNTAQTPTARKTKRCLLIDDNRSIRKFLRAIIESTGTEVIAEAESGIEGLIAFEKESPDLVFLDVDMPDLDGLGTLSCLMALHPEIPVVMVTSRADRETVMHSISLGSKGYLIKPFDQEKVVAVLKKMGAIS